MTLTVNGKKVTGMEWFREYWRTIAAIVYMLICLFDFILVPSLITHLEYRVRSRRANVYENVLQFKDHPEIMKIIAQDLALEGSDWMPYTLRGAGMFHIAFGAILTGTIVKQWKKGGTGNGKPKE